MKVIMIMARDNQGGIGRGAGLPWRLGTDLKHFYKVTQGATLIVGRKTKDTLPPLPGRKLVVLSSKDSRNPNWAKTPNEALEIARELSNDGTVFIAGGAEIYSLFLDDVDEAFITQVDNGNRSSADVFCHVQLNPKQFEVVDYTDYPATKRDQYPFVISHFRRKSNE